MLVWITTDIYGLLEILDGVAGVSCLNEAVRGLTGASPTAPSLHPSEHVKNEAWTSSLLTHGHCGGEAEREAVLVEQNLCSCGKVEQHRNRSEPCESRWCWVPAVGWGPFLTPAGRWRWCCWGWAHGAGMPQAFVSRSKHQWAAKVNLKKKKIHLHPRNMYTSGRVVMKINVMRRVRIPTDIYSVCPNKLVETSCEHELLSAVPRRHLTSWMPVFLQTHLYNLVFKCCKI